MKIAIVGLSHQGYIWSFFLAKLSINIGLFDANKNRINDLQKSIFPDYVKQEKNFKKYIKSFNKKKVVYENFIEISKFKNIIITEDVIVNDDFTKNISSVKKNINYILANASSNSNIILMSQVNPGTTRRLLLKDNKNYKFNIFYIPDFLTIGTAITTLINYKIFLIGGENRFLNKKNKNFLDIFFNLIKKKYRYTDIESAEIAKEAIQLKLSMDVTFVNLLSSLTEDKKLFLDDILEFMKLDKRFSKKGYWRPGLGFGGGHIERGLQYFRDNLAIRDSDFIKNLQNYNEKRIQWIINKVNKFKYVKTICIWGLTYKKNTSSIFRSYANRFISSIYNKYNFYIYDPGVDKNNAIFKKSKINFNESLFDNFDKFDCLLILSDWDEFKINKVDIKKFKRLKNKLIIDAFRILLPYKNTLKKMNIKYISLGYE